MLGRFGKDAGSLVGVEIAPPFIRLVQLRRQRSRFTVQAWALEPLPATAMHNAWIGDPDQVAAALLRAFRRCAIKTRRVAVALPGGLVIEKLLSMPADFDDDAIAERLPVDAGQFIPFALEDAAIDFQALPLEPEHLEHQRVAVAACHQALLDVLAASLESAGLRACVVEPDSHALRRAVQVDGEQQALLLHVEGEALVFHELNEGPQAQRREVSPYRQEDLAQSLVMAVDNYLLSRPERGLPGQLLLSGAGSGDRHLPGQLQQRLGMVVRHVNPFVSLALAQEIDADSIIAQAPQLAVACGLAMCEGERCVL